nr:alkaline phosphatase family protein [Rhodobacter sp.]
ANSQHAPYDVRYGEHLIADVYDALRKSDIWEQTLLVVTYDEHGGFFDHVYPPDQGILPPDHFSSPTEIDRKNFGYMFNKNGRPKPQYAFNFDRLGCRVPTVLVSPWLEAGMVESSRLQHTSLLATVRRMWGLRPVPLTAREGQAASFDHLLETRDSPRKDCPKKIPRPDLPERSLSAALDQPLSPVQQEVFDQVQQLTGHPDSGKPVAVPATQREASKYIAERRRAHDKAGGAPTPPEEPKLAAE